jgi:HEAT repeat protein
LNAIIDFILSQVQKETHPEIYAIFVEQLAIPIDCLLLTRHFLGIKSVLERLEKERSRFSDGVELSSIQAVYERIFEGKYIKIIIEELLNRIDKNIFYSDIAEIIILIGEVMINPLIDEAMIEDKHYLGYFGVYLRRRSIGEILGAIVKSYGRESISAILEEKLKSEQWGVVKNAIDLIMYIQEPALCSLLSPLIRHPDADVRKKVALALSRFPKPENLRILDELLKDQDSEVRLNAINLLAKAGDKSDIALLKNLNDPANKEAILAAVVALENRWGKN